MPVPIIVAEPAVGYGGGAALAFLHERLGRFRSLLARGFGLLVGADAATSDDDSAIYLTAMNAWSR